jgi:hypothetical protein
MADTAQAIKAINPDAKVTILEDNGVETLTWRDGTAEISQSDIDAKKAELTAAEDAAKVQKEADKANAKAKLIAGEALTEAEADTIVL